jgi:3-oxoacyl-[acyl-carrier protein] reductase
MGQLEGRHALVTGAASGIGRAIASAYAREGASLFLLDRDPRRLEDTATACCAAGAKVGTATVDVTDADGVRDSVAAAIESLGAIDVLVNCAGILTEVPLVEMDVATWDEMIAVDLRSVFLTCRFTVPHMLERGTGRVINIASQLGIKGGVGLTHYSAAKAGVIGFTKALALEVAPHGVLVNAIAPGPIDTPLVEGISPEWKRAKQAELPLGRFGRPEEVAPTAVLLASDPGGNLYVGQTLGPNSGDVMP